MPSLLTLKPKNTNPNIVIIDLRVHTKASEKYVDVIFKYPDIGMKWEGSIPYEYRRTGTDCKTDEEIIELLEEAYKELHPSKRRKWLAEQKKFWDKYNKEITRSFFDSLTSFEWKCVVCELPANRNWARRWQDIKEFGFTTATNTKKFCHKCKKNTTHLQIIPLPRGAMTGYETWSPELRKKILKTLKNHDAYEDTIRSHLLPDHKFPEIRWDKDTKEELSDNMTKEEIKKKFQLITNQRNQQKREVCRSCYQTGKRGYPFGIKFYYEGDENWPKDIPMRGKDAEKGCVGCGWYDLEKWRKELVKKVTSD